ncbi:MAG: diguanylate cyclase [bacterium]
MATATEKPDAGPATGGGSRGLQGGVAGAVALLARFSRRFASALIVLAVLVGVRVGLDLWLASSMGEATRMVDLAGRQRMLVGRIALNAHALEAAHPQPVRLAALTSIREDVAALLDAQRTLTSSSGPDDPPRPLPAELWSLYFEPPGRLDARMRDFQQTAMRVARQQRADPTIDTADLVALIGGARGELMRLLDRAAALYAERGERRRIRVMAASGLGAIAVLMALAAIHWTVFRPLTRAVLEEASRLAEAEQRYRFEAQKGRFGVELQEALEMADSEDGILNVTARAFGEIDPTHVMQMLLADSSRAHLRIVASNPSARAASCDVATPWDCPAVRRGRTLTFSSARGLKACPRLRERAAERCTAYCVPMTFMGNALGVVHAIGAESPGDPALFLSRLETLAAQASNRLGAARSLAQAQLQASTDPLTGLHNRRAFEAAFRELDASARSFTLAVADLDHFKRLNDTYGHDAGDAALRTFAKVVRECTRADDIAVRYGGEEFVLVLCGMKAADGVRVLDRIRTRLAAATLSGDTPRFTASFGLADPLPGETLDELVTIADAALLMAKAEGRDRVVVAPRSREPEALVSSTVEAPAEVAASLERSAPGPSTAAVRVADA